MNHDYAHCADYNEKCPKSCFRGALVRDLVNVPDYLPITFSNFKGTQYCKRRNEAADAMLRDVAPDCKPDWCPLVEVPTHGRLIDADKLYKKVKTECNPYGKPSISYVDGLIVLDLIDDAPTVIEASEDHEPDE